jgi:hypothetical protein
MHPSASIQLAELHQQELRAIATRARPVSTARGARRDRRANWLRLQLARLWHRVRSSTTQSDGAVTTGAQPFEFGNLAHELASHRPAAVEGELSRFIEHARRRGATPLLLSILADADQPDVVRERAFGRIVTELKSPPQGAAHRETDVSNVA